MGVEITPGECLQGQLGLAGITGMGHHCFCQPVELFSSRAAGSWGEFHGDATSKPLGKPALCGGGWGEQEVLAEGRVGDADLCSCTSTGAQEPGLVTPAVRNFEVLLPSAGNGQDRSELSNCFFQTTGRIYPSSLGLQLVGLSAGERDWSLNWDVCDGGNNPKMKCFKRETEQVY